MLDYHPVHHHKFVAKVCYQYHLKVVNDCVGNRDCDQLKSACKQCVLVGLNLVAKAMKYSSYEQCLKLHCF